MIDGVEGVVMVVSVVAVGALVRRRRGSLRPLLGTDPAMTGKQSQPHLQGFSEDSFPFPATKVRDVDTLIRS